MTLLMLRVYNPIKMTEKVKRFEVFKEGGAHGVGGKELGDIAYSTKFTRVGIKDNGKIIDNRNIFPIFDFLAASTRGKLVIRKPLYETRIKLAELNANRKANKLRG